MDILINEPWWIYVLHFLGGALFVNGIPHFVMGLTGQLHPTPFAKPPARGMSSPVINVIWGFVNLAAGFFLIKLHGYWWRSAGDISVIAAGALIAAVFLAWHFGRVRNNQG